MRKTLVPGTPSGARSQEAVAERPDAPSHDSPLTTVLPGVALTTLATLAAIVVVRYAGDVFIPVVLGMFVSYAGPQAGR